MPFDISSTRRSRGVGERDELEQPGPLALPPVEPASRWCRHEQLVGAHPAGKAEQLGEVAERARAFDEPAGAPSTPADAFGRPDESARDLHERRLAGAVRAEQADELALAHLEVDASQRLDGPETFLESADGKSRRAQSERIAARV